MKRILFLSALMVAPSLVHAGAIERACLRADRPAASTALCGCIQSVADVTLSRSEQRRAARFFGDPHRAQEVRQSDRAANEELWDNYKRFAASAQATCG